MEFLETLPTPIDVLSLVDTVLGYKKCGSKETEVSEVEKHLFKKTSLNANTKTRIFIYNVRRSVFY